MRLTDFRLQILRFGQSNQYFCKLKPAEQPSIVALLVLPSVRLHIGRFECDLNRDQVQVGVHVLSNGLEQALLTEHWVVWALGDQALKNLCYLGIHRLKCSL